MNVHFCFYRGEKENAESIVKSIRKYGDIDTIYVFTDDKKMIDDLKEIDSRLSNYKERIMPNWDYDFVSEQIANQISFQKALNNVVYLNITGISPDVSFAAHNATMINPVETYCINKNGKFIKIEVENLPEFSSLTDNQKRVMYELKMNMNGVRKDCIIISNGRNGTLKKRGIDSALTDLEKEELVTHESGKSGHVGRNAFLYSLTDKGRKFCSLHEARLDKLCKKNGKMVN